MTINVDPDQLASSDLDLPCLQREGISVFSRARVKITDEMTMGLMTKSIYTGDHCRRKPLIDPQ